jgi:hypothetical protein
MLCLQQPFPSNSFDNGDSSASRAHVVTVRRIYRNWTHSASLGSSLYRSGADPTENTASNEVQKQSNSEFFCCSYGRLPSDSPDIVDIFTGRYESTHVPSRNRCIATVLHAAIRGRYTFS